jgi:hypothetical protein
VVPQSAAPSPRPRWCRRRRHCRQPARSRTGPRIQFQARRASDDDRAERVRLRIGIPGAELRGDVLPTDSAGLGRAIIRQPARLQRLATAVAAARAPSAAANRHCWTPRPRRQRRCQRRADRGPGLRRSRGRRRGAWRRRHASPDAQAMQRRQRTVVGLPMHRPRAAWHARVPASPGSGDRHEGTRIAAPCSCRPAPAQARAICHGASPPCRTAAAVSLPPPALPLSAQESRPTDAPVGAADSPPFQRLLTSMRRHQMPSARVLERQFKARATTRACSPPPIRARWSAAAARPGP